MNKALLLLAALPAACAQYPQDAAYVDGEQVRLAQDLAVRTPGRPQTCLSSTVTNAQVSAVGDKLVYRDGNRIYVNRVGMGCHAAASPGNVLVFEKFGSSQSCRGDIVKVVSTGGGMYAGSCALGDFIPYALPGQRL
ncbi:hypothetical protein ABDK56_06620 [Sphingomonas sp. ASV193]|uniref:hypothetical protein n=1 Tax=Sphingomonas sp. ASV193 TaxID=3144405 RepID=UPI0032E873DA